MLLFWTARTRRRHSVQCCWAAFFPLHEQKPNTNTVTSSTRRDPHTQNSVVQDIFPSKRGDASQRVWRPSVDQLSSSPHSTPPMLSLMAAEALPPIPLHNNACQSDVCKTPMLITSKIQSQQSGATAEISPHAQWLLPCVSPQGSATWKLPANSCGFTQLQRLYSSEQLFTSASSG